VECAEYRAGAEALYSERIDKNVRDAIEPLLSGMGFSLVELSIGRLKGSTRVNVVIYRREGVGVEECAEVSSLLFPRLEATDDLPDVSLEVSSPGIERSIRSPAEYEIFVGRGVRILAGAESEWIRGIIDRVEAGSLWLRSGKETRGFALSGIRRARLDHSVEVEEDKNAV
jgi:ribosome maturation factor RimP